MVLTKTPVTVPVIMLSPVLSYRKELEHLYARRSALSALIQSLEDYDRFRAKRFEYRNEKTA